VRSYLPCIYYFELGILILLLDCRSYLFLLARRRQRSCGDEADEPYDQVGTNAYTRPSVPVAAGNLGQPRPVAISDQTD
jgi:hypothetical protein